MESTQFAGFVASGVPESNSKNVAAFHGVVGPTEGHAAADNI
jgi:hypothetical protein